MLFSVYGSVAAATVLPKFLKFWAPPHDLALFLIVGSFEPFGRALMLDDFKSLTLGLFSEVACVLNCLGCRL